MIHLWQTQNQILQARKRFPSVCFYNHPHWRGPAQGFRFYAITPARELFPFSLEASINIIQCHSQQNPYCKSFPKKWWFLLSCLCVCGYKEHCTCDMLFVQKTDCWNWVADIMMVVVSMIKWLHTILTFFIGRINQPRLRLISGGISGQSYWMFSITRRLPVTLTSL